MWTDFSDAVMFFLLVINRVCTSSSSACYSLVIIKLMRVHMRLIKIKKRERVRCVKTVARHALCEMNFKPKIHLNCDHA